VFLLRKTKIICTIGPASESPETIEKLLRAGMNVARLNFSHGSHEEHYKRIKTLREVSTRLGINLGILLDTKGPEIRTGLVPEEGITLENGQEFTLDSDQTLGSSERVSITYPNLWQEVKAGTKILIDDGLLSLEVISTGEGRIRTKVLNGGVLKSNKGINIPGQPTNLPALTPKDIDDILFGLKNGIDFIAASFTRKAADILEVRKLLESVEAEVGIIAKIENNEGLANLDSILEVVEGVMIARGDLGVEVPVEDVPLHQKEIIAKCNRLGKIVIVATQMLDSMIRQPLPTRAEASDVANAILDGTDAIMLSGETAAGSFPVEAVETMDKIARKAESMLHKKSVASFENSNIADAIGRACNTIAEDLNAAAIITPTQSGITARMISRYRPRALLIASTPYESVARSLSLNWGVHCILARETKGTDELLSVAVSGALDKNFIKTGDIVVLTAGVPVGKVGSTNLIKVQVVGNILTRGTGIGRKSYSGTARHLNSDEFQKGDILIASATEAEDLEKIVQAGALVVEQGGITSHAAIVAIECGLPAIVGATEAMDRIKDGSLITVDSSAGTVYEGAVSMV
jgi:pyruvate kinase